MTLSLLLAERYGDLKYNDLTPEAVGSAKQVLLDYLECTYAGVSFDELTNFLGVNHFRSLEEEFFKDLNLQVEHAGQRRAINSVKFHIRSNIRWGKWVSVTP